MKAHQLKNAILQLAVQGKLVPQNPNDEPASKLLERIADEKRRRIKAGEIKKDKRDSTIVRRGASFYEIANTTERCIDDELPFDLPNGWEWARLGAIGETNIGLTYKPSDLSKSGTPVLRSNNIQNGIIDYSDLIFVTCPVSERVTAHKGDILICARNGSRALVGKSAIICTEGMAFGAFMAIFRSVCNPYVQVFINSFLFREQLEGATTTTINQITQEMLKRQLIPIPPLAEQRRIVQRLESLLPLVEAYGKAEAELSELDARFPDMLKKSILQDAVQGKLVPQDPNDEPASVLLERIRAEKRRLIKEGKIKKDKHESVIFRRDNSHYEKLDGVERCIDGEIPFEIPENWGWVRLGNISSYAETKQKVNAANADPAIWGLDLEDIEKGGKLIVRKTVGERKAIGDKTVFAKGDILYSKLRPYLLKILIAHDDGICTPEIVPFRVYGGINPNYIVNYLKSPCVDNLINSITYGVKMPRVGTETMTSLLVPIPPLNEQHRIVQRIEAVLPLVVQV